MPNIAVFLLLLPFSSPIRFLLSSIEHNYKRKQKHRYLFHHLWQTTFVTSLYFDSLSYHMYNELIIHGILYHFNFSAKSIAFFAIYIQLAKTLNHLHFQQSNANRMENCRFFFSTSKLIYLNTPIKYRNSCEMKRQLTSSVWYANCL